MTWAQPSVEQDKMPASSKLLALVALALAGCASQPEPRGKVPDIPLADVLAIPEPTPRSEPRSALGNPPFYEALGKRYFVLASADGFVERGIASWYGPGFHKERTATGEPYDMYAMTAAHKTLPLPCYARVTNLNNGKSVVVYINDRGPFKEGRIVDLSYTAAAKLDILQAGTAPVELQVITPARPLTGSAPLVIQVGAYASEENARRLADRLRDAGYQPSIDRDTSGRQLYRVRLGSIDTVAEFDRVRAHLQTMG